MKCKLCFLLFFIYIMNLLASDDDWVTNGTNTTTTTNVGIGTINPLKRLHVIGPNGEGSIPSLGSQVAIFQNNVESTNNAVLGIIAGESGTGIQGVGGIQIGDKDQINRGIIHYYNPTDEMYIGTAGSTTSGVTIKSDGKVSFGSNITINSNYISGDGDDEGISVEDDGDVIISNKLGINGSPNYNFEVRSNGGISSTDYSVSWFGRTNTSESGLIIGYKADGTQSIYPIIRSGGDGVTGLAIGAGGSHKEAMFIKSSNGFLGLGTLNPLKRLHVIGPNGEGATPSVGSHVALFQNNIETTNNSILGIIAGESGTGIQGVGGIHIGDKDQISRGIIHYYNPTDEMYIGTAGSTTSGVTIKSDGKVSIGTNSPESDSKLTVAGKISAQDITIKADAGGADFVFEKDYALPSLDHVEQFVKKNKHLPEIPSAQEMQENGVQVSEMQTKLLQKIEELTLYMIEMKKENMAIISENNKMKNEIFSLKSRIIDLEQ